jgi:rRNA maturation RNase YbeY
LAKIRIISKWIVDTIEEEKSISGNILFIFTNDRFLNTLNQRYLNHKSFTDILTFDLSDKKNFLNAEIYISVERITENAHKYKVSFLQELYRVMIHGVLHLLDFQDKSTEDRKRMRAKEDYYLSLLPEIITQRL